MGKKSKNPTFCGYTRQQAYEIICDHLATQGRRAMGHSGCRYKNTQGQQCAIGILLTKEMMNRVVEGYSIIETLTNEEIAYELVAKEAVADRPEAVRMLKAIQEVHDMAEAPRSSEEIAKQLHDIAIRYGVTPGAEKALLAVVWQG